MAAESKAMRKRGRDEEEDRPATTAAMTVAAPLAKDAPIARFDWPLPTPSNPYSAVQLSASDIVQGRHVDILCEETKGEDIKYIWKTGVIVDIATDHSSICVHVSGRDARWLDANSKYLAPWKIYSDRPTLEARSLAEGESLKAEVAGRFFPSSDPSAPHMKPSARRWGRRGKPGRSCAPSLSVSSSSSSVVDALFSSPAIPQASTGAGSSSALWESSSASSFPSASFHHMVGALLSTPSAEAI